MAIYYYLHESTGAAICEISVQPKDELLYMQQAGQRYTDMPKPTCPAGFEARFLAGAWACYPVE